MRVGESKIGIVGLNTAWFSGERRFEDDTVVLDDKALIVGETQARKAYKAIEQSDFYITIMHHPFSLLADFDESLIKRIVMQNSDIILHGHIHSNTTTEIVEPDSKCITLSAGASYISGIDKRYNLCKINLEDSSYVTYLRRFSEEGKFWASDTLTYQKGDGIIKGRILKRVDERGGKHVMEYPLKEADKNTEKFLRYNWKHIVFNRSYDKKGLIKLRRNFFRNSGSNPSLHDIVLQTLHYLLENKIIDTKKGLDEVIRKSSFIDEQLHEFEKQNILSYFDEDYFEEQNRKRIFTSRDEIAKLKEREFLAKKESEISREIEKKMKRRYEEKEEKLREKKVELDIEYRLFKSKIDEYHSLDEKDLPKLKKLSSSIDRGVWYEELGLKENPFPSHIGLENINEALYDDIIVKTDIFHTFDSEITNLSQPITRKSYLIYGVMGSGKTTLFKYLQRTISILNPNTFAMLIPLESQAEFESIRYDFYRKICERLEAEYFKRARRPTGIKKDIINDSTISQLFKRLSELDQISNFIIFIDDLHKHSRFAKEVFEFISALQIFRSHMYENDINLSIFISGDLSWIVDTDGLKAIGGSIDTRRKIPETTIENAVEMINKRLKVFARNSDTPPAIKSEYVETIFKILKARQSMEITFRDVIEEVEKHWENYEFESLELSLILDFNTLSSMLLDIETDHPKVKAKIDCLLECAEKDERILNQFIEIIENLYLSKGISEGIPEFENYVDYYAHLYRIGLISKQRKDNSFVWVLTKDVRIMFQKFEHKYGFKPTEYLSKLFLTEDEDLKKKYVSEESARMAMILKSEGVYGEPFLRHIKCALDTYRLIFKHTTSIQEEYESQKLVEICKKTVTHLMKATLIVCENKDIKTEILYDVYEEFRDNWFENTDLTEFVDIIQKKETKESQIDPNDVMEICRAYFRTVKSMISNLKRFMKYNTVLTLESRFIYDQDKKILDDIRRNFYNDNYALTLDKVNSLLFRKLRNLIYILNCLLYGSSKWKRGLPPAINKKLKEGNMANFKDKNILNNLTLIDLTNILLGASDLTEKLLIALFGNEMWEVTKNTLSLEKELQKVNSESKINQKREDILRYVKQAKIIIEKVDSFYPLVFLDKIPIMLNYKLFGISPEKESKILYTYDIKDEILSQIRSKLIADRSVELNLNQYTPNPSFQNLNFVDWIMYVYYMDHVLKTISVNVIPNGGVIITALKK